MSHLHHNSDAHSVHKINKMLGGPHNLSGLPENKCFLAYPPYSPVTNVTELSKLPAPCHVCCPLSSTTLFVNQAAAQLVMKFHTCMNTNVCLHKSLWLVSTLSHIRPISNTTPYVRSMLILSFHLCPRLLTGLFHSELFNDLSILNVCIPRHFW